MKKTVSLMAMIALLVSLLPANIQAAGPPEGYELALEQPALALYLNREDGSVILMDRADGYLWRSNPGQADSRARGIHRQTLLSQITVSYSNERGTALSMASAADAVKAGGLSMDLQDDALRAIYDFPKQRIRVTLVYTLMPGYLSVRVPVDGITAYPDEEGNPNLNTVTAVDVLPLMGAGGMEDRGWLLVPDGSGALIRFNNGVTSMVEYSANLYGKDHGVEGQIGLSATLAAQARTQEQTARLPVFGVHHDDARGGHSLLGVITQNDAKAAVLARVSNLTSYNYAWSRFRLRNAGSMMMNSKEFGASVIGVSEREGLTTGTYEVRYYPLSGDRSGAAGMAAVYRDYLGSEQGLTPRVAPGQYPLYLEVWGQVKKPAQFMGIPYTKTHSLTTLADIRDMADALGLPQTVVRYHQWIRGSAFEKIPAGADLPGALGKTKDMKALHEHLAQTGGALYPSADLLNVYKGGNGFWAIRDAVLSPVNAPQMQFQTSWSSRAPDPHVPPWYLLSPAKYKRFFERFLASYEELGLEGIALDGLGEIATSDNRSGAGTGRGQVPGIVRGVLANANKSVMLSGGNAYAAALASHLLSTPGGSSGYTMADEALPFYQMVFHGMVPYGIGVTNHSADPQAFLLRCLAYGASPQYAFVARNGGELASSRLDFLFSPDYRAWLEEVQEGYRALSSVLAPLAQLPMTGYQNLGAMASVTVYGGQTAVYVNYADTPYEAGGLIIPARGYLVKEVRDGQ